MNTKFFRKALREWYIQNHRHLPWRDTHDPYCIWISEIILQQTRVVQGLAYYLRFVEHFPDVQTLAESEEEEVLRLWQGLGYYSRARNLHAAARQIMELHQGIFPTRYEDVRRLKGIGEYTAAAICSFAYNQPHAVVDGNVYRVLSRLTNNPTPIDSNAGKKLFNELAHALLDPQDPRTHNQAIMELGALQCTPGSVECADCPLVMVCEAAKHHTAENLPFKEKKTKIRERYFHYLYIETEQEVFMQKRTKKDIWQHLYEPPLIETDRALSREELLQHRDFISLTQGCGRVEIMAESSQKHILSHQHLHAHMVRIQIEKPNEHLQAYIKITKENEQNYPIPRLIELLRNKLVTN